MPQERLVIRSPVLFAIISENAGIVNIFVEIGYAYDFCTYSQDLPITDNQIMLSKCIFRSDSGNFYVRFSSPHV
jgi:hypothetical protein